MPIDFTATECGFDNGLGGASNSAGCDEHHYVLFGRDGDGVYFEYDDQIHGGIGQVVGIQVSPAFVEFSLTDGNKITVRKEMDDAKWSDFISGIRDAFSPTIVTDA